MVFEQFLEAKTINKHFTYVMLLGFFYVILSNILSKLFFKLEDNSLTNIFLVTIFLIPSIYMILKKEEKNDSKKGTKHFFTNHKYLIKTYFGLFIGLFIGFLFLNYYYPHTMNYQLNILKSRGDITSSLDLIKSNFNLQDTFGYISANTTVILIAFILSLFYGAGAIFLLILNASIFSTYIIYLFNDLNTFKVFIAMIHMIPEIFGFFIAIISGGIISIALMSEKFHSDRFNNILKDSIILLIISLSIIILSAIIETTIKYLFINYIL